MQQTNEMPIGPSRCTGLRVATRGAACVLRGDEKLLVLVMAYLFLLVALFALSFLISALAFFWIPVTLYGEMLLTLFRGVLAMLVFCTVLMPIGVGYVRMTGMIAAENEPTLVELFHYFASWHLWWRGVRIGLVSVLAIFAPWLFAAPALAIGNEDLSLSRALSLSVGRVPLLTVLAFWGRLLLHFLLGILTLGLLWLLYDAHHSTVTYFALAMQENTARAEEEL